MAKSRVIGEQLMLFGGPRKIRSRSYSGARSEWLLFRCTPAERDSIFDAARRAGVSVSRFVQCACQKAIE